MGILDDAKDKLGGAAEWVKDKAEHLGEQAQGAGQSLGEKAADARHWVGSRVGGDEQSDTPLGGEPVEDVRLGGGGGFDSAAAEPSAASEWIEITSDGSTVDGPGSAAPDAQGADEPFAAGGPIVDEPFAAAGPSVDEPFAEDEPPHDRPL